MLIVPGPAGKDLCDPQSRRHAPRHPAGGRLGPAGDEPGLAASSFRRPRPGRPGRGSAGRAGARPRASSWSTSRGGRATSTSGTPRTTSPRTSECVQDDRHQGPGDQLHRDPPQARAGRRQVHADPVDELHAQRSVQPHGRDLPDDDRLHDRQGQPVRAARAAEPEGLPQLRLEHHPAQAADRADAAVRDAPPAASGIERRRQGRHRRFPRARRTTRTRFTPRATTST